MKNRKVKGLYYPLLTKLGVKIYHDPCDYVISKDLAKVLSKKDRKLFSKYFGIQTCLLTDNGEQGLYCWDVESILERIANGKLIGSQAYWD
jgi:hypothetical protein